MPCAMLLALPSAQRQHLDFTRNHLLCGWARDHATLCKVSGSGQPLRHQLEKIASASKCISTMKIPWMQVRLHQRSSKPANESNREAGDAVSSRICVTIAFWCNRFFVCSYRYFTTDRKFENCTAFSQRIALTAGLHFETRLVWTYFVPTIPSLCLGPGVP